MVCKSMTPVDWYLIPCSAEMPFIDKGYALASTAVLIFYQSYAGCIFNV